MFNVIIAGGESTKNYDFFKQKCIYYLRNKGKSGEGITIYTTGDKFVSEFAERYRITLRYFVPDFKKNGKDAIRMINDEMLSTANALIAFENNTKSVNYLIEKAKAKDKLIRVVNYR